ncbi:MAG: hypothetical protein M1834_004790 [Cirrosporium novae-zelandiae]|nr:MAG: hypothetical protein M1834_004790 [Cirrosporium novae-zelandiae]
MPRPRSLILSPTPRSISISSDVIFQTHSRSSSRGGSPSRLRPSAIYELDPLLGKLSPSHTLEALTATEAVIVTNGSRDQSAIRNSIAHAPEAERALAIRAALTGKKLKEWCTELMDWPWPGGYGNNDNGFKPPDGITTVEEEGEKQNIPYLGSLPADTVDHYEERIAEIEQDMDDLEVEELKDHARLSHSRPSSAHNEIDPPSFPGSYVQLTDFTAIITATILQALPCLSRLILLLDTWLTRISILRQVPELLFGLEEARKALESAWNAISNTVLPGTPPLDRKAFNVIRSVLEDRVSSLGRCLDSMLDALEGSQDTLPDTWTDEMEKIEDDYGNWVVEAERIVLGAEWGILLNDIRDMGNEPEKPDPQGTAEDPDSGSQDLPITASVEVDALESQPVKSLDDSEIPEKPQTITGLSVIPQSPASQNDLPSSGFESTIHDAKYPPTSIEGKCNGEADVQSESIDQAIGQHQTANNDQVQYPSNSQSSNTLDALENLGFQDQAVDKSLPEVKTSEVTPSPPKDNVLENIDMLQVQPGSMETSSSDSRIPQRIDNFPLTPSKEPLEVVDLPELVSQGIPQVDIEEPHQASESAAPNMVLHPSPSLQELSQYLGSGDNQTPIYDRPSLTRASSNTFPVEQEPNMVSEPPIARDIHLLAPETDIKTHSTTNELVSTGLIVDSPLPSPKDPSFENRAQDQPDSTSLEEEQSNIDPKHPNSLESPKHNDTMVNDKKVDQQHEHPAEPDSIPSAHDLSSPIKLKAYSPKAEPQVDNDANTLPQEPIANGNSIEGIAASYVPEAEKQDDIDLFEGPKTSISISTSSPRSRDSTSDSQSSILDTPESVIHHTPLQLRNGRSVASQWFVESPRRPRTSRSEAAMGLESFDKIPTRYSDLETRDDLSAKPFQYSMNAVSNSSPIEEDHQARDHSPASEIDSRDERNTTSTEIDFASQNKNGDRNWVYPTSLDLENTISEEPNSVSSVNSRLAESDQGEQSPSLQQAKKRSASIETSEPGSPFSSRNANRDQIRIHIRTPSKPQESSFHPLRSARPSATRPEISPLQPAFHATGSNRSFPSSNSKGPLSPELQLEQKISSILDTIHAPIRLTTGPESDAPEVRSAQKKSLLSTPRIPPALGARRASSATTPTLTLAPAFNRKSSMRSGGDQNIKLYHLQQPGREAPIKLFIRLVGEEGERVMVRVGGGWADLGEYLHEYAIHHGHRSLSEGKFEVKNLPTPEAASTTSTPSVAMSDGRRTPASRPASALEFRSNSSLGLRRPRKSIGAFPEEPTTPTDTIFDQRPTSSCSSTSYRNSIFASSATSDTLAASPGAPFRSSSRLSWADVGESPPQPLGLAGPKSKKKEISREKQAWVDGMIGQARKASGAIAAERERAMERDNPRRNSAVGSWGRRSVAEGSINGDKTWGNMGKVGGTRRMWPKGERDAS